MRRTTTTLLQLHIRHVPGGLFTDQVFSSMKVRDILRFNGPHGSFYLREESPKPMILLAGGTGFAPIKAIVEHAIAEQCMRPMHIYWGAKARVDLYLNALPEQWAAEHANISYVPVLSEPATDDHWTGRSGLVHQAVIADFPDLSGHQVYACGAPAMIDAARHDFAATLQAAGRRVLRRRLHLLDDLIFGRFWPSTAPRRKHPWGAAVTESGAWPDAWSISAARRSP